MPSSPPETRFNDLHDQKSQGRVLFFGRTTVPEKNPINPITAGDRKKDQPETGEKWCNRTAATTATTAAAAVTTATAMNETATTAAATRQQQPWMKQDTREGGEEKTFGTWDGTRPNFLSPSWARAVLFEHGSKQIGLNFYSFIVALTKSYNFLTGLWFLQFWFK